MTRLASDAQQVQVFCLVFCSSTLSCTHTRCRVHQMTRLASDAQQVHGVLSSLLLIQPVLHTPDAEYIR